MNTGEAASNVAPAGHDTNMPRQPDALTLTVAVLAFNEAATIEGVVRDMWSTLEAMAIPYELIIVDDGSTDATTQIAGELAVECDSVRVVRHEQNRGLGGGYRSGFAHARGKFLTFFPADGQFPPSIIEPMLSRMSDYDLLLGVVDSRARPLVARVLSRCERLVYRAMFGRLPQFQGTFMLRRALLDELPLCSEGRGWAIVMELIIRVARGRYRIGNILTAIQPRLAGESKVNNVRTILANVRQVAVLRKCL